MSSRDDKLWAEEHWRSLGAALAGRGIQCLLPWGTEEERRRCTRIAAAIGGALVPQRMSLTELASLARKARFAVAVDTGLAHLAAALQVPVVGLYCGSDPALTGLYGGKWVRNLGDAGKPPAVAQVLEAVESLL
jgi:heptosyltransferase-1